jgi:hypothetical protein
VVVPCAVTGWSNSLVSGRGGKGVSCVSRVGNYHQHKRIRLEAEGREREERNQLSDKYKGEEYADGQTVGANTSPLLPEGS